MAEYHRGYARSPRAPEEARRQRLLLVYGLTEADYYRMLEDQGFCCASCWDELTPGRGTHIDHCHDTGRVRGVLCRGCNQAFGQLKDDPERVEQLLAYALRTNQRTPA